MRLRFGAFGADLPAEVTLCQLLTKFVSYWATVYSMPNFLMR